MREFKNLFYRQTNQKFVFALSYDAKLVIEIKAAFDLFDKDKSDNIDKHELRDAMRALGIRMTKKQIFDLMKEVLKRQPWFDARE